MQPPALATCAPGEQKLSPVPNHRNSVLYKIHLDTQNIHTGLANAVHTYTMPFFLGQQEAQRDPACPTWV